MTPPISKKSIKQCKNCKVKLFETNLICLSFRRHKPEQGRIGRSRKYYCSYECVYEDLKDFVVSNKLVSKKQKALDELEKMFDDAWLTED